MHHKDKIPIQQAEYYLRGFVYGRDCSGLGEETVQFKKLHDNEERIMDELRDLKREHNNRIKLHCSDIEKQATELVAEIKKWSM